MSAWISSLSGAAELVRLLVNERDRQKAAAIEIQLSEKILQAQAQALQVFEAIAAKDRAISALTERVGQLEARQSEKARYRLAKLSTSGDFFAYQLRPPGELEERADEDPHFVCQPCFDAGKRVVLSSNGDGYWWCPACKHGAQTEPSRSPTVVVGRRGRDVGGFY